MGVPLIKRKKLHFKSIESFPNCVTKYFNPGLIILQDNPESFGGLREALVKF
jgi:hypothetical protein